MTKNCINTVPFLSTQFVRFRAFRPLPGIILEQLYRFKEERIQVEGAETNLFKQSLTGRIFRALPRLLVHNKYAFLWPKILFTARSKHANIRISFATGYEPNCKRFTTTIYDLCSIHPAGRSTLPHRMKFPARHFPGPHPVHFLSPGSHRTHFQKRLLFARTQSDRCDCSQDVVASSQAALTISCVLAKDSWSPRSLTPDSLIVTLVSLSC